MTAAQTASLSRSDHWISEQDGLAHALFTAEGIHCAGCARAIEKALADLPGLESVSINVVARRVSVDFHPSKLSFERILRRVSEKGFKPVPIAGAGATAAARLERKQALKRIGVAALGGMQLMMYAVGLYSGAFSGIDPHLERMLQWSCLAITTPVLFYSGAPILAGAWREWRLGSLGMDTSIGLAVVLAYTASVINTLRGTGTVYFDTVTMFILFVLIARYFELSARHRSCAATEALACSLPESVQRVLTDGTTERVSLAEIRAGDRLRVTVGQAIPVDGRILEGQTRVDEALLTGESMALHRGPGERVLGGAINVGAAILIEATRSAQESTVNTIVRLLERASQSRPRIALLADRIARNFVFAVLVLTVCVGAAWAYFDPSRAFEAMLATLAVTCPCALSLAMPAALATTMESLSTRGLLVTRSDALETLAGVDTVALDKTGTLTLGAPQIIATELLGNLPQPAVLAHAAALERGSAHPLAAAFLPFANPALQAEGFEEVAGKGVEARIAGQRWRIGTLDFIHELLPGAKPPAAAHATSWLANEHAIMARFEIADGLRPEAKEAVAKLRELGLEVQLLSGDRPQIVADTARQLGIDRFAAAQTPDDKLKHVSDLQRRGHRVLMIGDGINDGPVLAAADVSLAMGGGTAIAQAAADLVLLRPDLRALPQAIVAARRCARIIRQNFCWAIGYNLSAVPLAAFGLISPWLAALGMSASSLLVVLNAQRLRKGAA